MKNRNTKARSESPNARKSPATESSVAEKVLGAVANTLKHWESGTNLDELLDSERESPHAAIVADIRFNYFRNKGLVDFAIAKFANSGKTGDLTNSRRHSDAMLFSKGNYSGIRD